MVEWLRRWIELKSTWAIDWTVESFAYVCIRERYLGKSRKLIKNASSGADLCTKRILGE